MVLVLRIIASQETASMRRQMVMHVKPGSAVVLLRRHLGRRGPERGTAWRRSFHPSASATNREVKEGRAPFTPGFWRQTER